MTAAPLNLNPPNRSPGALRARAAWLLALDLAEKALGHGSFVRLYSMPGKVGRGSDNRTSSARKLACYLTSTVGDCGLAAVAEAADLDRATVHRHVQAVEDWRDDGQLDAAIDELGKQMVVAAAGIVMANWRGAEA